jgi:hypothetical protein
MLREVTMSVPKMTTDHEEIRRWVEARGGRPAQLKGLGTADDPGVLRIGFPGPSGENLETVDWEVWFEAFDANAVAFLYEEETADGQPSFFNQVLWRSSVPPQVAGMRT